jgi:chemotaxis protein CheD
VSLVSHRQRQHYAHDWESRTDHHARFSYYEPRFRLHAIKVQPGEFAVTHDEVVLATVLGSCVSACIRDPYVHVGGMNHFMLAEAENANTARYGSFAMELLVNELLKRGAQRERLEAKVFGGANVLRGFGAKTVGNDNVAFVRAYLAAEGIPIIAEDLSGTHARKVCYFPRTGRALVAVPEARTVNIELASERAYSHRLRSDKPHGDVELF